MTDRVAVVAGGSGLIGRAVVQRLCADGWHVVYSYHNRGQVPDAPKEQVTACYADVGDPGTVATLLEEARAAGDLLGAVYCVGATLKKPSIATSPAEVQDLFGVNVVGGIDFSRLAARSMGRRRQGSVVLVSSLAAQGGMAAQAAYGASKAAIDGWVRSAAQEVGRLGVRLNAVAPGMVADDGPSLYSAEEQEAALARVPLRRPGEPAEVAAAIAFLLSDDAGYVHGSVLAVDGGFRP